LGAVEQGDYKVGIGEMRFTAGEDFEFGLCAKGFNFGLGDKIVREDYSDFFAATSSISLSLLSESSHTRISVNKGPAR
jgi:hypothetical protein